MISISDKVVDFASKKSFIGIVLKKEVSQFGWAGCVDIIRGEFIKDEKEINQKISYSVHECRGIKVFIPKNIDIDSSKDIIIKSNLTFFNMMILSVEIFENFQK